MRLSAIITFASLIATSSAADLALRGSSDGRQLDSCGPTIDARFEGRGPQPPVAGITTAGLVNGLYFNLSLFALGTFGVTGLIPHTPPNVVGFGLVPVTIRGTPSITTLESGTSYKTFNLESFYFGCIRPSIQSASTVLADCTVTATGYRAGVQIVKQVFTFTNPYFIGRMDMIPATATGFTNLDKVEFLGLGFPLEDSVAAVFDNILFKGCN